MDKQVRLGKFLILTFVIPFVIYVKTLLPTVGFWDTGEFQTIPYSFDIGHPTGYPTYVILGNIFLKVFPFGSVAWRMNLFSALSVSIGLFVLALLIKKLTLNKWLAVLIPLVLSVNPYLWSVATKADPHALHFLFTSLFILLSYLVIKNKSVKTLAILFFVTGFSLGNHMLSVFFLIPLIIILVYFIYFKRPSLPQLFLVCELFAIGVSVYFLLPLISSFKPLLTADYRIDTLANFKRHVLGEDFQNGMKDWLKGNFNETISFYFGLFKNSFPLYSWFIALIGSIVFFFKKESRVFNIILAILFTTTLFFSLRYQNAVIERYFLTSFLISSIWLATFLGLFLNKKRIINFNFIIYLYLIICIIFNLKENYTKIDASRDIYAHDWAVQSLSELPKNSHVYSWWSYSTPLWYVQKVEGLRTDIQVTNTGSGEWESLGKEASQNSDVYFIENVDLTDINFHLEQNGNLYKLVKNNN